MLSRNLLLQAVEGSGKPHRELFWERGPPQQCQRGEEPLDLEAKHQGSDGVRPEQILEGNPLPTSIGNISLNAGAPKTLETF